MGARLGFIPWKCWVDVILQLGKEPGSRELGLKSSKGLLNSASGFAGIPRLPGLLNPGLKLLGQVKG